MLVLLIVSFVRGSVHSNRGFYYQANFLSLPERLSLLGWLLSIHPIWEDRYCLPLPQGKEQRRLLRPVYWLGNWQFACLDYYYPPKRVENCCVRAEPFPSLIHSILERAEGIAKKVFPNEDFPKDWKWNTCLVNLYGSSFQDGKWTDSARVGEHRDYEPGPVASLSLGDRALFQFVTGTQQQGRAEVISQQWLEDRSLQMFSGPYWKDKLFHRVQRVESKQGEEFGIEIEGYRTRRVNLTFRYVPEEHVVRYRDLPDELRKNVERYVLELGKYSTYWSKEK